MSIINQSKNMQSLVHDASLLHARINIASLRLRLDVAKELLNLGVPPTPDNISKIIDGLPADVLSDEIARRT